MEHTKGGSMVNTGKQNDGVETLLNRLSKVTDQIAKSAVGARA